MDRFNDYGIDELKLAGGEFVKAFSQRTDALNRTRFESAAWTECVLDCFAARAREGVCVDASAPTTRRTEAFKLPKLLREIAGDRRDTHGEYLFDMSHSTWLPYGDNPQYGAPAYWEQSLEQPPELLLALESEFGKLGSSSATVSAVMEDASKLLHVSARAKVVVFGSTSGENKETLGYLAKQLADADRTKANWLWIDLPWPIWEGDIKPEFAIHGARGAP